MKLIHKIFVLLSIVIPFSLQAQTATQSENPPQASGSTSSSATKSVSLPTILVTAKAGESSRQVTDLSVGTSTYTLNQQQINTIAQGQNTPFNQVLVRTPGVSDDTFGAIHFRNEDPYYRYYINGTLLPSGINGFDQDIDTRFVESLTTRSARCLPCIPRAITALLISRPRAARA